MSSNANTENIDLESLKNEEPMVKMSKGRLTFSVIILYLLFALILVNIFDFSH